MGLIVSVTQSVAPTTDVAPGAEWNPLLNITYEGVALHSNR